MLPNPQPYFANLPDPRRETKNKLHKLEDIMISVLCTVCCLRFLDGIKKTPVLKREELYQGLIEPGWGAGLLNPAQGGERNILYMTPPTLNSFLSAG
jgi:hypothetical protein